MDKKWWILIIVLVVLLAGITAWLLLKKPKCSKVSTPGLGKRCKCDQKGDDTSKFYGDNWKARGAVCDGAYIPTGANLGGLSAAQVLESMSDLTGGSGVYPKDMLALTQKAVTSHLA